MKIRLVLALLILLISASLVSGAQRSHKKPSGKQVQKSGDSPATVANGVEFVDPTPAFFIISFQFANEEIYKQAASLMPKPYISADELRRSLFIASTQKYRYRVVEIEIDVVNADKPRIVYISRPVVLDPGKVEENYKALESSLIFSAVSMPRITQ